MLLIKNKIILKLNWHNFRKFQIMRRCNSGNFKVTDNYKIYVCGVDFISGDFHETGNKNLATFEITFKYCQTK